MRIAIERDVLGRGPLLEIGRLRLWVVQGWRPVLYFRRDFGHLLFGVGYWAGMYFLRDDERRAETIRKLGVRADGGKR